jgi:UDP-2,3-diacylglucosamine pyrophosphatase LpxH
LHLGTRGCQADRLLDFLRHHEADTIYLVGDIVDGWALRSSWYWPQPHNDVVQKLLRAARKGVRLIYVPGNHDEFLRGYYGTRFGGMEVVENIVHEGADGRRYLVVHGDVFDLVVTQARWLALLGDKAYEFALAANRVFNTLRRRAARWPIRDHHLDRERPRPLAGQPAGAAAGGIIALLPLRNFDVMPGLDPGIHDDVPHRKSFDMLAW